MYSTSARSGIGRDTCDECGSVTRTTDDPGAAYSWGWWLVGYFVINLGVGRARG